MMVGAVPSSSVVSDFLLPHGLQPARLLYTLNSPGKNAGRVAISFSSVGDYQNPRLGTFWQSSG